MFENLRHSLDDLLARATKPEDRRAVLAQMKDALVHARMGVEDLRGGVEVTRARVAQERRELETVVRRKALAEQIGDAETVTVATRFERQHADRVRVQEAKLQAQEAELALAEREVAEMTTELKRAAVGVPHVNATGAAGAGKPLDDPLEDGSAALGSELDALARAGRRARQDADADARLAELKRRMGK
jgi:hypothetical protein